MDKKFDGTPISELRKMLNLTQLEFARLMDVDPITVSRWEGGKRKPLPIHRRKLERLIKKRLGKEVSVGEHIKEV